MNTWQLLKVNEKEDFRSNNQEVCLVDLDEERRRMLRSKVKQGVAAAETLKRRMRETPVSPKAAATTTTTTTPPSENCKILLFAPIEFI